MDTQRKNKSKRPDNTRKQEPETQLAATLADKATQEMLQQDFTELLATDFSELLATDFTDLLATDFSDLLAADFTELLAADFVELEQLAKELAELDTLQ